MVLFISGVLGENVWVVLWIISNWVGFGDNVFFISGDIDILGVLIELDILGVLWIVVWKVCIVFGVLLFGVGVRFLWFVLFWVGVVGSVEGDGIWNDCGGVFVWEFIINFEWKVMLVLFWII